MALRQQNGDGQRLDCGHAGAGPGPGRRSRHHLGQPPGADVPRVRLRRRHRDPAGDRGPHPTRQGHPRPAGPRELRPAPATLGRGRLLPGRITEGPVRDVRRRGRRPPAGPPPCTTGPHLRRELHHRARADPSRLRRGRRDHPPAAVADRGRTEGTEGGNRARLRAHRRPRPRLQERQHRPVGLRRGRAGPAGGGRWAVGHRGPPTAAASPRPVGSAMPSCAGSTTTAEQCSRCPRKTSGSPRWRGTPSADRRWRCAPVATWTPARRG